MNQELIVLIVMTLVFAILGVMLLLGKADFVMKKHILKSGKYDLQRLRIVHAVAFFVVDIMFILLACGVEEHVAVFGTMPVVVVVGILQYTWAKKKE